MTVPNRNQLLARVHVLKKELGLDDDIYRDIVERLVGSRSAKDATDRQLGDLVAELASKQGGFKPSERAEVRLVWALWGELKKQGKLDSPTPAALRAFCANQTGAAGAAKDPEHLTSAECRKVSEALKAWADRPAKASA
jgi:phage gp16-like protein